MVDDFKTCFLNYDASSLTTCRMCSLSDDCRKYTVLVSYVVVDDIMDNLVSHIRNSPSLTVPDTNYTVRLLDVLEFTDDIEIRREVA
jgi:hypothetical protein